MALGEYIQGEAKNVDGIGYRITIYKEAYVGAITTLQLGVDVAKIKYEPITDDISSPLCPSSCEVFFVLENDSQQIKVDDVLSSQNDEFYILIEQDKNTLPNYDDAAAARYRYNVLADAGEVIGFECLEDFINELQSIPSSGTEATDYQPYWRGIVQQEMAQVQDTSARGRSIVITANDGLAQSQYVQSNNTNDRTDPNIGYEFKSLREYINDILGAVLPADLWSANETFSVQTSYWWEDQQNYGDLLNPLNTIGMDVLFYDTAENNGLTSRTNFDVLEDLAYKFLARVYMADGAWHFEQVDAANYDANVRSYYDKSNNELYIAKVFTTETLNQQRNKARLSGGVFDRYPSLRSVKVTSETSIRNVTLATGDGGVSLGLSALLGGVTDTLIGNNSVLDVVTTFSTSASVTLNAAQIGNVYGHVQLRPVIELQLVYRDFTTNTTYYWQNNTAGSRNGSWVTSPASAGFKAFGPALSYFNNGPYSTRTFKYESTDPQLSGLNSVVESVATIPTSGGELTLKINAFYMQYKTSTGWARYTPYNTTFSSIFQIVKVVKRFPNGTGTYTQSVNSSTASNRFGIDLALEKSWLDSVFDRGSLVYFDGSDRVSVTGSWNIKNQSQGINVASLLASQRLAIQDDIVDEWNGTILYPYGYGIRPKFDSRRWIPIEAEIVLGRNEYSGSFREVLDSSLETTIDIDTEPELGFTESGRLANGGEVFVSGDDSFGGGFFGKMSRDENNVLHNPEVFMFDNAQRNSNRVVTASDGSVSTISDETAVVLVTWSGATGATGFTLRLPAATDKDGQTLEIILDDTFEGAGSTDVIITSKGSELVKGQASITLSDDLDRLFLRAVKGNWW